MGEANYLNQFLDFIDFLYTGGILLVHFIVYTIYSPKKMPLSILSSLIFVSYLLTPLISLHLPLSPLHSSSSQNIMSH